MEIVSKTLAWTCVGTLVTYQIGLASLWEKSASKMSWINGTFPSDVLLPEDYKRRLSLHDEKLSQVDSVRGNVYISWARTREVLVVDFYTFVKPRHDVCRFDLVCGVINWTDTFSSFDGKYRLQYDLFQK